MPYVFSTSYLPYNKTKEAAKIYVDTLKEFRAEVRGLRKEIIPNAIKSRKDHIEVVGVSDVEESNLAKYLQIQQKYMTKYHDLEGYGYDIEVRFKVTEALEMIGLKMPE
ncbi:MAG: hypothetical protein EU535_05650 [Promethearchaeota archaeon]|nr:MAG: hypothetical protein EU535_05650 [Candidatus Lokiarchaeota archaeon]